MNTEPTNSTFEEGDGRLEGEGTTNGGLTTKEAAGLEPLPNDEFIEESADVDSNTLGGTEETGGEAVVREQ